MSIGPAGERIDVEDFEASAGAIASLRRRVFVEELGAPAALVGDADDPACVHVLARDMAGGVVGSGRLQPPAADPLAAARIGRLAVDPGRRGRGLGAALLRRLLDEAHRRGWRTVELDAHAGSVALYRRHGFRPVGPPFAVDGIAHQAMRWRDGPFAIADRDEAVGVTRVLAEACRRRLSVYTRDLDPGLFDAPPVLEALRRLGTAGRQAEVRILLQDAAAPQRGHAPLLALAQRLPSVFAFREVDDPVDRAYPAAFVANDAGGYYFRALGHRFDGEAGLQAAGRSRQLQDGFDRVWERARPVSEYRALGL